MKKLLILIAASCCAISCFESALSSTYTSVEQVFVNWDGTHAEELARDIYTEEIMNAQGGYMNGKYVMVDDVANCDSLIQLAKDGSAKAKARVLADGLQKIEGLAQHPHYKVVEVESEEDADFGVLVVLSWGLDKYYVLKDYYKFTHNVPVVEYVQPEAIDLGGSVLWASFNVGATKPEEFGGFYMWGDTQNKKEYPSDEYKWWNGSDYTKYFAGNVLSVLEASDDAAVVNLGNGWRTPTYAEFEELADCNLEYETINGFWCGKFTANNGSFVYLPLAGAKDEQGANTVFSFYGNYMIANRYSDGANSASKFYGYHHYFRFPSGGYFFFESSARSGAIPVRAVKDKDN